MAEWLDGSMTCRRDCRDGEMPEWIDGKWPNEMANEKWKMRLV
jgi:hypothetical protein